MILQYTDIFTGKIKRIRATATCNHPASHYGIPVIVLHDGEALDANSWVLLNYRIIKASEKELAKIRQALSPFVEFKK